MNGANNKKSSALAHEQNSKNKLYKNNTIFFRNQQQRCGKVETAIAAPSGRPTATAAVQTVSSSLQPQVLTLNEQIYIKKEQQV